MPLSVLLTLFGTLLLFPAFVGAEPLSYYSCDIAKEKLVKAQRTLKTVREELRKSQRQEQYARAELWTCVPGGTFSLARTRRCGHVRDHLPTTIKQTIAATHRVEEEQEAVSARQTWQMKVCVTTP